MPFSSQTSPFSGLCIKIRCLFQGADFGSAHFFPIGEGFGFFVFFGKQNESIASTKKRPRPYHKKARQTAFSRSSFIWSRLSAQYSASFMRSFEPLSKSIWYSPAPSHSSSMTSIRRCCSRRRARTMSRVWGGATVAKQKTLQWGF